MWTSVTKSWFERLQSGLFEWLVTWLNQNMTDTCNHSKPYDWKIWIPSNLPNLARWRKSTSVCDLMASNISTSSFVSWSAWPGSSLSWAVWIGAEKGKRLAELTLWPDLRIPLESDCPEDGCHKMGPLQMIIKISTEQWMSPPLQWIKLRLQQNCQYLKWTISFKDNIFLLCCCYVFGFRAAMFQSWGWCFFC